MSKASLKKQIQKLIESGEMAREKEDYARAKEILDQAGFLAALNQDWQDLIDVVNHKIIIYKHFYLNERSAKNLKLFHGQIENALSIATQYKVSAESKAVAWLRLGDYHIFRKEFKKAVQAQSKALKLIKSRGGKYAEFLGHFAHSQAKAGIKSSLASFDKALKIARADKTLRPFHKLVITSGILLRSAEAHYQFGNKEKAAIALREAAADAQTLAKRFKLKIRQKQAQELSQKLKVKI